MIIVHHLENSRSQRILWLLEELGAEYEVKRYPRDPVTSLAPKALKDIHPLGKSPVITDGDIVVAESGAIVEYLMEKFGAGKLQPEDNDAARRAHTYYMHYAEGTVMPLLIIALLLNRIDTAKMPFFVKPIAKGITGKVRESYLTPNLTSNLKFMENTLGESTWFTGSTLTAADVHMSFIVEGLNVSIDLAKDFPNLAAFMKRCHERPAYQKALEVGGPFELGQRR
ncbi:MAG: glutathione S-transferase family protein [Woeseiaceae bacterium]